MAMKNLANCARVFEKAQQTRQFGVTAGKPRNDALKVSTSKLHVTAQQSYPVAAALPLPANIDPSESTRFSPQRNRDICAHAILTHQQSCTSVDKPLDITVDNSNTLVDPHVESYDCRGAVNLNSAMQSNVPSPFGGMHKFTHLNMPGGQWSQDSKFMSHNLQSSHYTNLRREARATWSEYDENATSTMSVKQGTHYLPSVEMLLFRSKAILSRNHDLHELTRQFSTAIVHSNKNANNLPAHDKMVAGADLAETADRAQAPPTKDGVSGSLSRKDKLKRALKEYGGTVIVFHVGISLMSLGICYVLVSRGVDVTPFLQKIGLSGDNEIAAGASTFVIAYAIHKVFAPVRISMTLACTPLIVRYLRAKGILKGKKN